MVLDGVPHGMRVAYVPSDALNEHVASLRKRYLENMRLRHASSGVLHERRGVGKERDDPVAPFLVLGDVGTRAVLVLSLAMEVAALLRARTLANKSLQVPAVGYSDREHFTILRIVSFATIIRGCNCRPGSPDAIALQVSRRSVVISQRRR